MGWEQRPHSAASSPDGFCPHLGPLERLTCVLVALQQAALTSAATEAAPAAAPTGRQRGAAEGKGWGSAALGSTQLRAQGVGSAAAAAVSGHLGTS